METDRKWESSVSSLARCRSGFIKPSPSHLVNCSHIANIGKDTLEVGGDTVPLSRRRRKECLEKLARVIGGRLS